MNKKRYNYVMQYDDIDETLFKPLSTDLPNENVERLGVFKTFLTSHKTHIDVAIIKAIDSDSRRAFPLISIMDRTTDGTSATNAMEHVLNHIAKLLNIDLLGVTIIYRDSALSWDGVRIKNYIVDNASATLEITDVNFISLNDRSLTETRAAEMMLDMNRVESYSAHVNNE